MNTLFKKIKQNRQFAKENLDKKLIQRLRIFALVFIVMLGIIVFEINSGAISIILSTGAILIGIVIGIFSGRMFNIYWHPEKELVVARMDKIGIVILVLYILFSVARSWIFGYFVHGSELSAFTLSFGAGAILGRLLSMGFNIRKVLGL